MVDQKFYPLYLTNIECSENDCWRTAETCIFKKPKGSHPEILKEISKKVRGKFNKIHLPLNAMVDVALVQALSGDKEAFQFFAKDSPLLDKFDPRSSEQYYASRKLLERVAGGGCLDRKEDKAASEKSKKNKKANRKK